MRKLFIGIFFFISCTLMAQDLKVMTYNIKYDNPSDTANNWQNRKEFLISQLNYNAPDVFGTQEGLHHQLEDIQNGLENYKYIGVGRDNGDEEGEYSAIFYNVDKLKVISENTFWLSPTPDKPSKGWDAALNRICTYAEFENKASGKRFMVFNTHFDHIGEVARYESAKLILKKIKALNKEQLPVALTGDFNLDSTSKGVVEIKKEMIDAHSEAGKNAFGPDGTFNGFHFEKPVKNKIDFIFISKNDFKVLKSGILSDSKNCKYPSDHFPVVVYLDFK
ncbi:endonuclease/exonuclease/phosphatase family protein [Galbibacter pacificus]|uniref:Endonuclease/exonuclease/phosphatase family protein n=1 Tax=Galbibacter pacificus TaxID=2996052 RepID=A0ABT6FPC3_9FLAO|nr:endonuclease/exonuclease/phosphatase family protein [Galbibacter pacificus]MDG3581529.1 endonuclease/exonuclease/phosphatase family protein [Galbibacter pacificus]MDG3585007.1 endonuclease/exonuclease/phosphatase family protein [Galbibacter pacificus]